MNTEFLYQVAAYAAIFLMATLFYNFLSQGFLFKLIKARAGRGGRVLMKVHGVTGAYWVVGALEAEFLLWKARGDKDVRRLMLRREHLSRMFAVPYVDVDEVSNNIVTPDFKYAVPFDAKAADLLVLRALMRGDKKGLILLIIVLVLVFAVGCGVAYVAVQQNELRAVIEGLNVVSSVVVGQ